MGDRMRGKTYVYFNGKTEYIGTGGEEQTAYPLGSLVFGTLDVDWEPYLEQARALRRAYTGVDFGETCTMPQRLSEPETCVYYQVAEFYHNMSLSVKTVSPAFFDLLEGYCLAVWRAYDQESEPYLEALASGVNDTGLSRSEVHQRLIHLGNQAITGNIMEGYCRSFPAYTEQMKYYIEWETEDRSLCETALLVLVRPFSGSAALAVGAELMARYGVDSQIGRTAAVMLGSTETTFYTISVYFGAAGVKKTRYALPAALIADLTGFCMAALSVRVFFR